jgi:hypothetical protein
MPCSRRVWRRDRSGSPGIVGASGRGLHGYRAERRRPGCRSGVVPDHLRLHRERCLQSGKPGLGSEPGMDWTALGRRHRTRVPPEPSHCEGTARERRCG